MKQFKKIQRTTPLSEKQFGEEQGTFSGYLSTFNKDKVNDVILSNAFDKSLKAKNRVPMLFQHDKSQAIGYLDLQKDDKGIKAKGKLYIDINDNAKTVYQLLKDNALNDMSVGMAVSDYKINEKSNGYYIKEAQIYEGSIVLNPANSEARIHAVKDHNESLSSNIFDDLNNLKEDVKKIKAKLNSDSSSTEQLVSEEIKDNESENSTKEKTIGEQIAEINSEIQKGRKI